MSALEIIYSNSSQRRLEEITVAMAPAFRDKFDFSDPKQHDELAAMALLSAKAIVKAIDKEFEGKRPNGGEAKPAEVKP